jgi:hypothetical protein
MEKNLSRDSQSPDCEFNAGRSVTHSVVMTDNVAGRHVISAESIDSIFSRPPY